MRRTTVLFCYIVLSLVASASYAGARRITSMDRFSDALCTASPEVVSLDPIQKALRNLAKALSESCPECGPASLTFDDGGGVGTLSIYCRATCYDNCQYRCNTTYQSCGAQCNSRNDTCLANCEKKPPAQYWACADLCSAAVRACFDPCESEWNNCHNGCFDTCCFDY